MNRQIRDAMLDADMNARYWKGMVARYQHREKILKIFIALTSSGTVATWSLWGSLPLLWKSLSTMSAVLSIALPIINLQRKVEIMADLTGRWGELRIEYEILYKKSKEPNVNHDQIEEIHKEFKQIEASLQYTEAKLPNDKNLLIKCYKEVCKARGLI
jgi:hypothetical protein